MQLPRLQLLECLHLQEQELKLKQPQQALQVAVGYLAHANLLAWGWTPPPPPSHASENPLAWGG